MGRQLSHPEVQKASKKFLHTILDHHEEFAVRVGVPNDYTFYSSEELTTVILTKLKSMAEAHLNTTVKYTVTTIPPRVRRPPTGCNYQSCGAGTARGAAASGRAERYCDGFPSSEHVLRRKWGGRGLSLHHLRRSSRPATHDPPAVSEMRV